MHMKQTVQIDFYFPIIFKDFIGIYNQFSIKSNLCRLDVAIEFRLISQRYICKCSMQAEETPDVAGIRNQRQLQILSGDIGTPELFQTNCNTVLI